MGADLFKDFPLPRLRAGEVYERRAGLGPREGAEDKGVGVVTDRSQPLYQLRVQSEAPLGISSRPSTNATSFETSGASEPQAGVRCLWLMRDAGVKAVAGPLPAEW